MSTYRYPYSDAGRQQQLGDGHFCVAYSSLHYSGEEELRGADEEAAPGHATSRGVGTGSLPPYLSLIKQLTLNIVSNYTSYVSYCIVLHVLNKLHRLEVDVFFMSKYLLLSKTLTQ